MQKNLFGTDGIRVPVGTSPLSLSSLPILGNAISRWAIKQFGKNPRLLIARDTRDSGDWIISALSAGLLLSPVSLYYAGVLPTPTVCRILPQHNYDAGIIISASHNLYSDNGIKIIDREQRKISKSEELYISTLFQQGSSFTHNVFGSLQYHKAPAQDYIHDLISLFPTTFLKGLKIAIDCAHGATYQIAPLLFKALGAELITINANPNGKNINKNCGALDIRDLQKTVLKYQADIGFAFDGDGDRVIAANKEGIIKNGDDMLALLSQHPHYNQQKTIVGTIMSNIGLDLFFERHGKTLLRSSVGDKFVSEYLSEHQLLLGGEQSGHIILHDYLQTGDGIFTALRLCETMIATNNWTLKTFDHYPQILINLPVTKKKDLTEPEIAAIIKDHETQLGTERLVIRYSGTENLLRIMIEGKSESAIKQVSDNLARKLQKHLL